MPTELLLGGQWTTASLKLITTDYTWIHDLAAQIHSLNLFPTPWEQRGWLLSLNAADRQLEIDVYIQAWDLEIKFRVLFLRCFTDNFPGYICKLKAKFCPPFSGRRQQRDADTSGFRKHKCQAMFPGNIFSEKAHSPANSARFPKRKRPLSNNSKHTSVSYPIPS